MNSIAKRKIEDLSKQGFSEYTATVLHKDDQYCIIGELGDVRWVAAQTQKTKPYAWHIKGIKSMDSFFTLREMDAKYWKLHNCKVVPVYVNLSEAAIASQTQQKEQEPYAYEVQIKDCTELVYALYFKECGEQPPKDAVPLYLESQQQKEPVLWLNLPSLPREGMTVLVKNDKGQVAPMVDGIIQNSSGTPWDWGESVTGWMPLPRAHMNKVNKLGGADT